MQEARNEESILEVYISYDRKDESFFKELEKNLRPLVREKRVSLWSKDEINVGAIREQEMKTHLEKASIILLLLSPDYIAFYDHDTIFENQYIQEHLTAKPECILMPIFVRHISLDAIPWLKGRQSLPRNNEPIIGLPNQDVAFVEIQDELRKIVENRYRQAQRVATRDLQLAPPVSEAVVVPPVPPVSVTVTPVIDTTITSEEDEIPVVKGTQENTPVLPIETRGSEEQQKDLSSNASVENDEKETPGKTGFTSRSRRADLLVKSQRVLLNGKSIFLIVISILLLTCIIGSINVFHATILVVISIIVSIMLLIALSIFLLLVVLISYSRRAFLFVLKHSRNRLFGERRIVILSMVLLVIVIVNLSLAFGTLHTVQAAVSIIDGTPRVGLCDGRCVLDIRRLNGPLKERAAQLLSSQHDATQHKVACAYLNWARNEDTTDAEAAIYFEDQCSGEQQGSALHCPCLNYVVAVSLIEDRVVSSVENLDSTMTLDSAVYSNGVSRSILQGAYLRQKAWNDEHRATNGPFMYLFVANFGDVANENASNWQQAVADHIVSVRENDSEHSIDGVVGLPEGKDTLTDKLAQHAIPMVSVTSLSNTGDAGQYLLSIAPSIEDEMSASAYFLTRTRNIVTKRRTFPVAVYYSGADLYRTMANSFEEDVIGSGDTVGNLPRPYFTTQDVKQMADNAANHYGVIFFAGPFADIYTFVSELRIKDKNAIVITCNTAYQRVYSYLPPDKKEPLTNLFFTTFAYHQLADNVKIDEITCMDGVNYYADIVGAFRCTYDPDSIHTGNIYMYQLPTSDALLSYDALSVFTLLVDPHNNYKLPNWLSLRQCLADEKCPNIQQQPWHMTSGNVRYGTTHSTPMNKVVLLLTIKPGGNTYIASYSGN